MRDASEGRASPGTQHLPPDGLDIGGGEQRQQLRLGGDSHVVQLRFQAEELTNLRGKRFVKKYSIWLNNLVELTLRAQHFLDMLDM